MNTVRNVSFAALTAVVLSAGSACGMDGKSLLNNAQGSPATTPLGFAVAGSILNRTGYAKLGDRCTKAGIVGGVYAVSTGNKGTYRGAVVTALTDVVLREALERAAKTQVGQTVAEYLPEFVTSDVAKEVVCGCAAVVVGYKADQCTSAKTVSKE